MLRIHRFYCYSSVVNLKSPAFLFKGLRRVLLLIFTFLLASGHALAKQPVALYDVDILVVNESAGVRAEAFRQGLQEVFIRISGDSIVMDKMKPPQSSRYVKQFSYDPVQNPTTNDKGVKLTHRLKIQYNGSLMEKYLLGKGFPVWSEHRPEVVVWLAVRDGKNAYVLKESDQSQLKTAVEKALNRRGVPERWPLYDAKDKKILRVADIRGGFKDPVATASKRYSRGPSLTGSLSWNGKEWQSSWSLFLASENRHWSVVNTNYNVLINKAIDQAADALGVVYATHGATDKQRLVTIQLGIQEVDSIEKYSRVESYLSVLSRVESVKPLRVDGQSVAFEVKLRSTEEDFLNLVQNDAELIKVKTQPASEVKRLMHTQNTTDGSANKNEIEPKQNPPDFMLDQQYQIPIYHYKLSH